MNTRTYFLCLFLISLLVYGCRKDDDKDTNYDVSGYLYTNGQPIANASVNLDDMVQYQAISGSDGYFEIKGVSEGDHNLKTVKTYEDGSFITRSFELDVNGDLMLNFLLLPNPVSLLGVDIDTLLNEVTVRWNKSSADDFREYKIYSHTTSGLDETTGKLEHVATFRDDTLVTLPIPNATTMFYRVFVLNAFGQLGGSNIESTTSGNRNFFTGGDFEDEALFLSAWTVEGNAYIIDSVSYNNSKSLYFFADWDTAGFDWTTFVIDSPPLLLNKNEVYKLSFWYKARGFGYLMNLSFCLYYEQDNQNYLFTDFYPAVWEPIWSDGMLGYFDEDWTYYSLTFFPTSDGAVQFTFFGSVDQFFIDDLQLKRKLD